MKGKLIIHIIFFTFLSTLFFSCKKEKSSLIFSSVSSGTDFNLHAIRSFQTGKLLACGGKENKGIILTSGDEGNTWSLLSDTFDQVIYDVYFFDELFGFAAGGTPDVFKTIDGGRSWEKLYLPFPATGFPLAYRVPLRQIFFVNDSTGFICGGGRFEAGIIFKTTNSGQNWTLNVFDLELRSIYFLNETTGFTCGFGAILKTTDSGISWDFIAVPNEFYTSMHYSNGELFVSGYNGGILNSKDGGTTWNFLNKSNNVTSSRSHFNCLASIANSKLIACGADGIASISTDNGITWDEGEAFNGSTIKSIFLTNENSGIAAGTDGKIFVFSF
ncbi:MAG: YCF48-related protein [Bacteroidia bacterium]